MKSKKALSKKEISAIVIALTLVVYLFVSTSAKIILNPGLPETPYSSTEASVLLKEAKKVSVRKRFNFKKQYVIFADGIACAVVEGDFLPVLGDVFTLKAANGDKLLTEKEEVFHLNSQAQFYDNDGNKTIRYERNFTPWSSSDIVSASGTVTGVYSWSAPFNDKITEADEETYGITKSFLVNHYEITKNEETTSNVSIEEVILMCCIEDAIRGHSSSSSNSNKN